ncbi:hypothetical protein [Acinetobacter indicus]|uniref:hypothetical protein n=1 Tax=Acinetobacter indicus TaxID=756892 RepID=UPI0032B37C34
MTNRLELNWNLDGFVDEQRYYCAEIPIDTVMPPVPKAILAGDIRTHTDASIDAGKLYYIRISSVVNEIEKFSSEISISTQSSFNPLWQNVKALILADAASYPSSNIVDKTGTASILSTNAAIQVSKPEFWTGGAFLINQNSTRLQIESSSYSFGIADFIVECEFLLSPEAVATGFYWGIINIGSVYGETGRSIDLGIVSGVLYASIRPSDSSGYAVNYDTQASVVANTKYHLAIMRKSGIIYFFLNGIVIHTQNESILLTLGCIRFCQGGGAASRYLNSVRVSTEAFYPETGFIPPTQYPIP